MKSFRFALLIALSLALTTSAMAADFGIRAGRLSDAGEEFVGAELVFDAGPINVNPNVEYILNSDFRAGSANLDVTLDVGTLAIATPYIGAGLGLGYFDDDLGNSDTTLLGNAIGGLQFNLAALRPYAQVKYSVSLEDENDGGDDDEIAFVVGIRF